MNTQTPKKPPQQVERDWTEVAAELCKETNSKRMMKLSKELTQALDRAKKPPRTAHLAA